MTATGIYSLTKNSSGSDLSITAAGTAICTAITGLDGMTAVTISARLAYGSGGSTVIAYIQTSIDQGTTWIDIAAVAFGAASEHQVLNLSGLTPKTTFATPTDGTLTNDTAVDAVLGDRLRCKVVSTGVYAGSTVLSVRASIR